MLQITIDALAMSYPKQFPLTSSSLIEQAIRSTLMPYNEQTAEFSLNTLKCSLHPNALILGQRVFGTA